MRLIHKNKIATSLALISILSFQPTISFAKEDPINPHPPVIKILLISTGLG